ncbi:MAG: ribosome maturation factor RimP [Clostridia bacterium]|nr:ribosome maturation factor RimP [Clostridia bacterium]MDD4276011.1 ribosome maturation factor RimP [Clostridia bacterium]
MAVKRIADLIKEVTEKVILDLGYELVDVEYLKKFDGMNLTLYIYKPVTEGGITIDDCEKISNAVDPILEALDPTKGVSYRFNVSSMGLDRPIKTDKDFMRAKGTEIEIKLFAPLENQKLYTGILADITDTSIVLDTLNGKFQIDKEKIATALPVIKF